MATLNFLLLFGIFIFTFTTVFSSPLEGGGISNGKYNHYGNDFCIAFPSIEPTASLSLVISTENEVPVDFIITFRSAPVVNGTVYFNDSATVDLPSALIVSPAETDLFNYNGVRITTLNSNYSISVLVLVETSSHINPSLANPLREINQISQYRFSHFSFSPSSPDYSMFALVTCDRIDVVPFVQAPASLDNIVSVKDVYRLSTDSRETISGTGPTPLRMLVSHEIIHFESIGIDLTGFSAWSRNPFSFLSTQLCTSSSASCMTNSILHIPPTYTWGYTYLLGPLSSANYTFKILPIHQDTFIDVICGEGPSYNLTDELVTFDGLAVMAHGSVSCSISSNRPVAVVQEQGFTVWITSTSQYLRKHVFTTNISDNNAIEHYASITVLSECFNVSDITLDGSVLEPDASRYMPVHCDDSGNPCGYALNTLISVGTHMIEHLTPGCCLNVIVYGFGQEKGYAFPAGYGMDPIGVPTVAFIAGHFYGSENDTSIAITITRTGDLYSQFHIKLEIESTIDTNDLRQDFALTEFNVTFATGQTVSIVNIRINDDQRVEDTEVFSLILSHQLDNVILSMAKADLTIQDNDYLVIGFQTDSISVPEDVGIVNLILQSNIPLQDGGMIIREITSERTADARTDYQGFNRGRSLGPTQSRWLIPVEITDNNVVENEESFIVRFTVSAYSVTWDVGITMVTINITDNDIVTIRFRLPSVYFFTEGNKNESIIIEVASGQSDIPVSFLATTSDITAIGGTDYVPINGLRLVLLPRVRSVPLVVSLLDDNGLESNETFSIQLTNSSHPQLRFNFPSVAMVTITNDDSVVVGFNVNKLNEINIDENSTPLNLTLQIFNGQSYINFLIHVQTFPQQALPYEDYIPINADVVFPANESSIIIPVEIVDNSIAERSSEGFTIGVTSSDIDKKFVLINESRQRVVIAIDENDRVLVRIDDSVTYAVREGEHLSIRLTKEGVTDTSVMVGVIPFIFPRSSSTVDYNDYDILDDIVTFEANEKVKTYDSLFIKNDDQFEDEETIVLILEAVRGPVNVDLNQFVTVRVLDSDVTVVGFTALEYTFSEGVMTGNVSLSVTGSGVNATAVIINTSSLNATSSADFKPISDYVLNISAGVKTVEFSIDIIDDGILEYAESFVVTLHQVPGVSIVLEDQSMATIHITDNDNVTLSFRDDVITVNEDVHSVNIIIDKLGISQVPVGYNITITGITATHIYDYVYIGPAEGYIMSNETSGSFTVYITDDEILELLHETFSITITSSDNGVLIGKGTVTITITDNDVAEVYFNSVEYTSSAVAAVLTISWSKPIAIPASVSVRTRDGTARSQGVSPNLIDYIPLVTNVTLSSSRQNTTISVEIMNDRIIEDDEYFYVDITNPFPTHQIVIRSNSSRAIVNIPDFLSTAVAVVINADSSVYENDGFIDFKIEFILDQIRERIINITFETKSFTAKAGEDFVPVKVPVIFHPNETVKNIRVHLINDSVSERQEVFAGTIDIGREIVLFVASPSRNVTILDDEAVILGFEQSSYNIPEGSQIQVNILQTGIGDNNEHLILLESTNIEATGGSDYSAVDTTLSFNGRSKSVNFSVQSFPDNIFESNESFAISLSLPSAIEQKGVKIDNERREIILNIIDTTILTLQGSSRLSVDESDGSAIVCFTTSTVIADDIITLRTIYTEAILQPATGGVDYNDSVEDVTLIRGGNEVCVNVKLISDNVIENDEHICLSLTHPSSNRLTIMTDDTPYCPPSFITITIRQEATNDVKCTINDGVIVNTFSNGPPVSYTSGCEHIALRSCDGLITPLLVTVRHSLNTLSLSGVGIRANNTIITISHNLTLSSSGNITNIFKLSSSEDSLSLYLLSFGVSVTVLSNSTGSSVIIDVTNSTRDVSYCGLCGTRDGGLLYSDRETTGGSIDGFVKSWLVNPNEYIIDGSVSEDCGTIKNDSVVGDPLYSIPLNINNTNGRISDASLCYEIHGAPGIVFNLISDHCVSVNALYSSLDVDTNIISAIGLKAVDNSGQCRGIVISVTSDCHPVVDGVNVVRYSRYGVDVVRYSEGRVRISVPNCEKEQLVMWATCVQINGQKMIDFTISRAINLNPTSHGLVGQFWNIPVDVRHYDTQLSQSLQDDFDVTNLYQITVFPVSGVPRRFIGELFHRNWSKSLKRCIYAGNSQGASLADIKGGPQDSVIEGNYIDYAVPGGLLKTDFTFNQFQSSLYRNC